MKGVYIFLADGFEDIEALAPLDILLRGGVDVRTVSLNEDNFVTSAHNVPILAQMNIDEFYQSVDESKTSGSDMMIFPGGMPGAKNLASEKALMSIMARHYVSGGSIAAICASPAVVLAGKMPSGTLRGLEMTCYDGFEDALENAGAVYVRKGVAESKRIITGRGPGLAIAFGLKILEYLKGSEVSAKVAAGMML